MEILNEGRFTCRATNNAIFVLRRGQISVFNRAANNNNRDEREAPTFGSRHFIVIRTRVKTHVAAHLMPASWLSHPLVHPLGESFADAANVHGNPRVAF